MSSFRFNMIWVNDICYLATWCSTILHVKHVFYVNKILFPNSILFWSNLAKSARIKNNLYLVLRMATNLWHSSTGVTCFLHWIMFFPPYFFIYIVRILTQNPTKSSDCSLQHQFVVVNQLKSLISTPGMSPDKGISQMSLTLFQ